jgi:hypothetical protein
MQDLEAELHQVLLDLAPDTHNEEQARIVAVASLIYGHLSKTGVRESKTRLHESRLADALLQAMGQLDDFDYDDSPQYIDGRGLTPEQIVHQASMNFGGRYAASNFDAIDEDIDMFLEHPSHEYIIEDGEDDAHPPDRYQTPGRGSHRSDSLSR